MEEANGRYFDTIAMVNYCEIVLAVMACINGYLVSWSSA